MMAPELRDARWAGRGSGVALTSTDEKKAWRTFTRRESVQWDPCIPQLTPSPGLDYFCEWPRRLSPRRFGRRLGRSSPRILSGSFRNVLVQALRRVLSSICCSSSSRAPPMAPSRGFLVAFIMISLLSSSSASTQTWSFPWIPCGTFLDTSDPDSDTHPQAHWWISVA